MELACTERVRPNWEHTVPTQPSVLLTHVPDTSLPSSFAKNRANYPVRTCLAIRFIRKFVNLRSVGILKNFFNFSLSFVSFKIFTIASHTFVLMLSKRVQHPANMDHLQSGRNKSLRLNLQSSESVVANSEV